MRKLGTVNIAIDHKISTNLPGDEMYIEIGKFAISLNINMPWVCRSTCNISLMNIANKYGIWNLYVRWIE